MSDEQNSIDVLADEFLTRLRRGELVTIDDYTRAHPDLADEIREVFGALLMMEQVRPSDGTANHTTTAAPPPSRLGEYRVLREIGRGGMGVVYEAVQESLGRHVALKVLPPATPGKDDHVERFRREARAAARLHHTNIVPVFGVGSDCGTHFYVMQYIHGQPLDDVLAEIRQLRTGSQTKVIATSEVANNLLTATFAPASGNDTPRIEAKSAGTPSPFNFSSDSSTLAKQPEARYFRASAKIIHQAAEALAYAHNQGVLHRDIKPSNLLLDIHGTTWVTDFGLAKLEDDADLTRTGDIIGTLRYMAPERFRGESDARSDVYALGVTLYEMLTLTPAFAAKDKMELIEQVTQSSVPPPRLVDRHIPRDLDTIVHKATARESKDRYATAKAMAEDLERYLNDQPIRARRQGLIERTMKWAKRRPAAAALVATIATVLFGTAVASLWMSSIFATHRNELQKALIERDSELDKVKQANELASNIQAHSDYLLARASWPAGEVLNTRDFLSRVPVKHRGWGWRYAHRQSQGTPATLYGHSQGIQAIAYSPDGTRLVTGSYDHIIKVWDTRTGRDELTLRGHSGGVYSVATSPDGARLASCSTDKTIKIWNLRTEQEELTLRGHTGGVYAVAFSPDGTQLVSAGEEPMIKVWDARTGVEKLSMRGHTDSVSSVAFSPDGTRLASSSFDNFIKLWDARTGREELTLRDTNGVTSIAFSPDGTRLASGNFDCAIKVWDVRTGRDELTMRVLGTAIYCVGFSPDGAHLATGCANGAIKVWDARTGREEITLRGHGSAVMNVTFSPDGARLASGGHDNTIKMWDAREWRDEMTLRGHTSNVRSVAVSPDGARLASGSYDNTIKVWDARTGRDELTMRGHTNVVLSVAYSPDGTRLASASNDNSIKLWDAWTGREVLTLRGHTSTVACVAYSPDSARLASGSHDSNIKVWDARTGREELTLRWNDRHVYCVAFSPDGTRLASGSNDNLVKLWDAGTGREELTLHGHAGGVYSVAFSPDGTRLASGSEDNTIKLWDARAGREELSLRGHTSYVMSVAFSPDGSRLVSGSFDNAIKVWDARTGREELSLRGHTNGVNGVAFSPDGSRLVSGSNDHTIKVWDARMGREELSLRGHTSYVRSFAFRPDGGRLATGSNDYTVKLWNARNGREELTLRGHSSGVTCVTFNSGGWRVASGCEDHTIKVWNARTGKNDLTLRGHASSVANVAFSPNGRLMASRDDKGVEKAWDLSTGKEIQDEGAKEWLAREIYRSRSPDGQWLVTTHDDGTVLLTKPKPFDDIDSGYWEYLSRFDPVWARERSRQLLEAGNWYGARFHLDRILAAKPGDGAARLDRARCRLEMDDWPGYLADARAALPWFEGSILGIDDSIWHAGYVRLACGDHEGFQDMNRRLSKSLMAKGGLPCLFAGMLAAHGMADGMVLAAAIDEVHSDSGQIIHVASVSPHVSDMIFLDACSVTPEARLKYDIRMGQRIDPKRLKTNGVGYDQLWNALAYWNNGDKEMVRKELAAAEKWLTEPSKENRDRSNAAILGHANRLDFELLRREVREKLGMAVDQQKLPPG